VQTEILVAVNSVVKEIVEYAEKQDVDLIVIGTRGMSGLKRILLGSTSSGVVKYAHCPVLVVKKIDVRNSSTALHLVNT